MYVALLIVGERRSITEHHLSLLTTQIIGRKNIQKDVEGCYGKFGKFLERPPHQDLNCNVTITMSSAFAIALALKNHRYNSGSITH